MFYGALRLANTVLNRLGLSLVPHADAKPGHVSGISVSELMSELARFEAKEVVARVPLSSGRGLPQFSWGEEGTHPFVRAARIAMTCSSVQEVRGAIATSLADFYDSYQPSSIHDIFWPAENAFGDLGHYPAWAAMMPWQGGDDIDSWMLKIAETVRKEGRNGRQRLTIDDGWSWSGPVSRAKLEYEVKRLTRVVLAINKNGYRRHDGFDGDIRAVLLMKSDGAWVWQSYAGQHRAAALSASGVTDVPVRFSAVVREAEVATWPQVVSGLYSVDQARHIFDRVFSGPLWP